MQNSHYCRIMRFPKIYFLLFLAQMLTGKGLFAQNNVVYPDHFYGTDTIVIGSEPDYPPYCILDDNGNADGFSVDLFKAAAAAVGLEVEIRIDIWSRIMEDLATGEIDALPLVGRTPEREELFDFTLPYMSLHGAVFVRRGTTGISSVEDLEDKEIVLMQGDNAEEFVRRYNISDKIFTTSTFKDAFLKLAGGEHDAVIMQRVTGINLLGELGLSSVVPLDLQLPRFRQDFCFAVREGDYILLNRLNEGLSIVIADGTYEELRHKWFGPQEQGELTIQDILRLAVSLFVPMLIIMSVFWIIFLRRQVKSKTLVLNDEISERKQREKELIKLKAQLESQVEERTAELKEKVRKLDQNQKAMQQMIEDLNDIRKELEAEREKLEFSNKELKAFTNSVSHDLRVPLRAISGFARFLVEDYANTIDDEGRRYLYTIRENANRMDQLISGMLDLSRVSRAAVKLIPADMGDIARSILHEVASDRERELFDIRIEKMPEVVCDSLLIKQVWQNLIENALKYSSKSKIKKIRIGSEDDNQEIRFHIRDWGSGFPDKYKHNLFGMFQRLHSEDEFAGTGVGLAIVKRIVHRHGGKVWAEGKINEGATFYFSLPRK